MNTLRYTLLASIISVTSVYGEEAEQKSPPSQNREAVVSAPKVVKQMQRRVLYPEGSLHKEQSLVKTDAKGYVSHGLETEFYPSGQLKSQGLKVLGKRHGSWTFQQENGFTIQGEYQSGNRTGNWRTWAPGKRLRADEHFASEKLHGSRRSYHDNDKLATDEFYVNGRLQGVAKRWYSNGRLETEESWVNGKRHGVSKQWDEYGVLLAGGEYFMDVPVGSWEWRDLHNRVIRSSTLKRGTGFFYDYMVSGNVDENGTEDRQVVLKSEISLRDGKRHGTVKTFYPDTTLETTVLYVNGKKEGGFQEFFPNGRLKRKGSHKNDELVGVIEEFYASEKDSKESEVVAKRTTVDKKSGLTRVEEFSEEGKKLTLITMRNNTPHGEFTVYYPDGKTMMRVGRFQNGEKAGRWREFYPDSQLKSETLYQANREHGVVQEWYQAEGDKEPQILTKGHFRNGKRDGEWMAWYKDGSIEASKAYRSGLEDGKYQEFWPREKDAKESKLRVNGSYSLGKQTGTWTISYANGLKKSEVSFRDGKKHGKVKEWYDFVNRGKPVVRVKGEFSDGEQDGYWEAFFPNGRTEYSQQYSKGRLNGQARHYYETGALKQETFYVEGMQQEESTSFHPNKKVRSRARFQDGHLHGEFTFHYENGKPMIKGTYQRGLPVGTWRWFEQNGRSVITTSDFIKGTGTMYQFHPNGKKKKETSFVSGVKWGKEVEWHESGQIRSRSQWERGVLNGPYKEFHTNGELIAEGKYRNGQKHGTHHSSFGNKQQHYSLVFDRDVLNGESKEWYDNGQLKAKGQWKEGVRQGKWYWFDRYGDTLFELTYDSGLVTETKSPAKAVETEKVE